MKNLRLRHSQSKTLTWRHWRQRRRQAWHQSCHKDRLLRRSVREIYREGRTEARHHHKSWLLVMHTSNFRSRTVGIQGIEEKFLRKRGDHTDVVKRQIISLGCGYDTFVFSLMSNREKYCPFSYFELDLQEVAQKKVCVKFNCRWSLSKKARNFSQPWIVQTWRSRHWTQLQARTMD